MSAAPRRKTGTTEVRRHNLAVVLGAVPPGGTTSRAAISSVTGLAKATVSALVGDLIELGLVEDAEAVVAGPSPGGPSPGPHAGAPRAPLSGRPATPLRRRAGAVIGIGADLAPGRARFATTDLTGSVEHHDEVVIGTDPDEVATAMADVLAGLVVDAGGRGGAVAGIGVAVPGLVAPDGDIVLIAPTLAWRDVSFRPLLQQALEDRVGLDAPRVHLANEANDAALAEYRRGVGQLRAVGSMLYLSAGAGVGAGIVVDGAIFRGAHGFGGELGHVVVEPDGAACSCGKRGCLETIVGAKGLADRRFPATADGLAPVARALGVALAAAVGLFDPELVVLGGTLAGMAPHVVPAITDAIDAWALGAAWVRYEVVAGELGTAAGVIGAADRALESVRVDPLVLSATGTP